MKIYLKSALCAASLMCYGIASGQADYYWSENRKINLTEDHSSFIVQFKDGVAPENVLKSNSFASSIEIHSSKSRAVVHLEGDRNEPLSAQLNQIVTDPSMVRSVMNGWKLDDGFQVWQTDAVVLKLGKGKSIVDLSAFLTRYHAKVSTEQYGRIVLKLDNVEDALPLANQLKEEGVATWAHPDFYAKIQHSLTPSDTYYGNQFQMNNSNDVDCDAPEAWDISLGNSNIRIAIIDDGVEAHPDLPNLNTSLGYSPINNGNGTPNASGAHGEACAGIIGAAHNGVGVAGAIPNSELFSVNIFLGGETGNDLANAISYAKNNGADILSNSWGFGSCTYTISALNSAISDAKNNGRSGKGCVIVFASGNDSGNCVSYPASNSDVIAVGAIGNTGSIASYSNQGNKLDISAPSSGGTLGVYTTDRQGSAGYANGSYTSTFGGTSAACPLVSGVAGLVLSVNNSLTSAEVQTILENTATDMGSSGFDVAFGHGRVDADDAMIAAGGSGDNGGGSGGNTGGSADCVSGPISFSLVTDNYGSETSWTLTNSSGAVIESGSGYGNNTTINLSWNLDGGDYTFTINDSYGDGICCSYGNGSYSLSSNAGTIGSGGSFGSIETVNFCVEAENAGGGNQDDCPTIDLSATNIESYGGGQDAGSSSVGSQGELVISNNAWKSIDYNYTITSNTVIEFDFGSTDQGEIHGIGFDNNSGISSDRTFRLYGSQNWGIGNYDDYASSAGSWKSYVIPVGQFYTGSVNRLFFVCDDDAGNGGNSYYRNIKVYEGSCSGTAMAVNHEVKNIDWASEGEEFVGLTLFPNPASDMITIELTEDVDSKGMILDVMGRVIREVNVSLGKTKVNIGELPSGMYQLTLVLDDGTRVTKKFMKSN